MRPKFSAFAAKAFGTAFALLLLALSSAHAAGLGKLTVLSSLGQPLRAEIELTSVAPGEADNIVVKLASYDDYKKANLEFTSALHSLRFAVEKRGARHIVRVSSVQSLNEPFVGMLLELRANGARLTREYTFLLDPADLRTTAPAVTAAPASVQPAAEPKPAAPAPAPAVRESGEASKSPDEISARAQAIKAKADAAPQPAPTASSEEKVAKKGKVKEEKESTTVQHKVKKGDTLAVIARKYKHDEVTLEQMLVSLYQTNPHAFVGKNMNRMRVGKVLNVPDAETAGSVTKSEARKIVVAQASDFASYRRKLAAQAAQAVPQSSEDGAQAAGGKITAKVEEKPTPAQTAQDRLKLSKASGKAAKAPAGTVSAEDKAATDKALAEERARVKELEKNVKELQDLQKSVELKNRQLAEQQKLAEKAAADKAAADKAAADKLAAATAAAGKAASVPRAASAPGMASAPVIAGAASVPTASVPAASVPPVAAKPAKPAIKRVAPPPPPPSQPGFFDDMLANPLMLGGLGVVVLLLVYMLLRMRSKKKSPPSGLGGSLVTDAGSESPNSLFGSSGGQSVDTNNSIFNSGFTPSASLLDANEVDPVAEADVYIAYGREAQAIEILKEALRSHPERNALRIKLLEIYAAQKDVHAFDLLAGELYALTHGEGEEWVYVAGLGIAIDPTNPLYAGGDMSEELLARPTSLQGSLTQPTAALDPETQLVKPRIVATTTDEFIQPTREQIESPDLLLDLSAPEPGAATASNALSPTFEPATAAKPELPSLNFDLQIPAPKAEAKPAEAASASLNFDLGDFDFKKSEPAPAVATTGLSVSEGSVADFEFMPKSSTPPTADLDFEAQLAVADLELAAVGKVEPYTATAQETMKTSEPAVTPPAAAAPIEFDFGGLNLDLEQKPKAASAGHAEMDTKIELASAYLGIGDKEGARELLEEVIQQGSPEQVEKARQSLAKIS